MSGATLESRVDMLEMQITELLNPDRKKGEGVKALIPSVTYRSMIYAAVATIHFYSKDVDLGGNDSIELFKQNNAELVKRVFQEIMNIFNYELSAAQMAKAIYGYLHGVFHAQSIKNTGAFELGGLNENRAVSKL